MAKKFTFDISKGFVEEKKTKPRMGAHPKDFSIKGGPGPRGKFLKRMNMGGVMKNRGGTFKGTF